VLAAAAAGPGEATTRPPGSATPPPSTADVAAQFTELEVIEMVGSGGMGAVYKVRQPQLDRLVALKILSRDLARDPNFAERFNREARVLARLAHPNIVTVFDFGARGPFCFLLMEFVDGVNLRQAMRAGGFTPAESLELVRDICGALQFAHEEGVLHRDIKPENILIDRRGRVKIADFGIAKLVGGGAGGDDFTLTARGAVLGSMHYMAPEQIETPGDIDQRADIYSLGVVFYELLTGELPLGRFAPPSQKSHTDVRIDEIVMRALEKERRLRYQSAAEVKTGVEAIRSAPEAAPGPGMAVAQSGFSGQAPPPAGPPALGTSGTAKRATAAAVLTGSSFLLAGVAVAILLPAVFWIRSRGGGAGPVGIVPLGLLGFFAVSVPALLGLVFGVNALAEVRASGGRKRGLCRGMFAALAWPLLVVVSLAAVGSAMGFVGMAGPGLAWLVLATATAVAIGVPIILIVWRWALALPWGSRARDLPGGRAGVGQVAAIAAVTVAVLSLVILVPWGMLSHFEPETSVDAGPQPGIEQARFPAVERPEPDSSPGPD
jgi:tRNA A-37 threonylcarbamoyl transferase component Bud32